MKILLILLLFAVNSFGQDCPQPALQNAMTGITVAENQKAIGGKFTAIKDQSFAKIIGTKLTSYKTTGTKYVYLRSYKNIVYEIVVAYDNSIEWKDLKEFAKNTSQNLELPDKWTFGINETGIPEANLRCDGFNLSARYNYFHYTLILTDLEIYWTVLADYRIKEKEIEAAKQKKKNAFKP